MYKEQFIKAIQEKKMIRLTFFSKADGSSLIRKCAPMDFAPSRRAADKTPRYHFWDFESDTKNHTLSLLPNQIKFMENLNETFDPAEFITWNTTTSPWSVPRDWGQYS